MDSELEIARLKATLAVYADPANWHSHTTGHGESATIAFTEPGKPYASGFWLAKEALDQGWKRPKASYGTPITTKDFSQMVPKRLEASLGIEGK